MDNKHKVRISLSKQITKIDIKAGKMTFGQRIDLGKILASEDNELEKFEKVFMLLHKFKPEVKEYEILLDYFKEIILGLNHWIEHESRMLNYEPTLREETSYGNNQSVPGQKEFKVLDTVNALAKKYSVKPTDVLSWDYEKVFNILLTDLVNYKRKINIIESN